MNYKFTAILIVMLCLLALFADPAYPRNEYLNNSDRCGEIDVSVDIQNATLHMKRVKKPYISLATVDGKAVRKIKEIDIKVKK